MGRVRILYVIDSLAPGGAERSLVSIAPHLMERGIELRVAAVQDRDDLRDDLEHAGVEVVHLTPAGRPGRVRQLAALVRSIRPDLVHTTLFEADIAGRLAAAMERVPCVCTLANESYGMDYAGQPGVSAVRLRAAQAGDVATARLVRRFHAVSEGVAATMTRRLLIPRRRIDVVHRGRDPEVLGRRTPGRTRAKRLALGVGAGPLVVAVARHEYDKGLDVAIQAMARVRRLAPDAVLVVAGRQGNQTGELEGLIREAGLGRSVRLLGPRDDVADLLAAADVFMAPSRREGLPGAVLEAMALEAPIVASDLPAMREVLGDDGACAHLVPIGSADAFADAVVDAFGSAGSMAARTSNGRRRFEQMFTVHRAAVGMVAFYERALRP